MNSSLDFTNGNHIRFQFKFNLTKRKFPAKVWQLSFLNAASHLVSYKSKTQIQEQAIILYVLKKTIKQMSSHIYNSSTQQLCFTQWADLSSDFFFRTFGFFYFLCLTYCNQALTHQLYMLKNLFLKFHRFWLIKTELWLVKFTSWKLNLLWLSNRKTSTWYNKVPVILIHNLLSQGFDLFGGCS